MLKFLRVTATSKHNITQLSLVAAVLLMRSGCEGVMVDCESGRWLEEVVRGFYEHVKMRRVWC